MATLQPKISVIIPTYNGEKFITRAIESVLNQTTPVHEIIVINDGSTDQTHDVVQRYMDKIIYKMIPNGGVSRARNIGIEISCGDWVAFLDSDDEWLLNKLEQQVAFIKQYSEVGMIFSTYDLASGQHDNMQKIPFSQIHLLGQDAIRRNKPVIDDCFYLLFVENFIKTSTVMIRRDVLKQTGLFDENLRTVEDRDLFIRVANLTKVLFLGEPLVRKWQVSNSLGQENMGVINDRERVQWLNLGRYHEKIEKSGKTVFIQNAISATKRSRLASFYHSRDFRGMLLSGIDFLMYKTLRWNMKIFVN